VRLPAVVVLVVATVLAIARPVEAQRPAAAAGAGGSRVGRTEELNISVGENKTIAADGVVNYSEGSPGVADVRLTTDGSQFVVIGVKAGTTTLLLIFRDGSHKNWVINVFSRPPDQIERELQQLLQSDVGVHLRRVGLRFFIEGGVSTEADQKRYEHIASLYPGQVESLVQVGSVAQDRQLNVRIDFFFAQFNRDFGYNVGVTWPSTVGDSLVGSATWDFLAHAITQATASVVNQPLPFLDIAQHRGWAKVLRQATLITGNGSEAKLSNGGEQNFLIANNLVANIRAIEFGLNLAVLPRFDPDSRDMEVKVVADVGDLTPPGVSTTLPGRNTAKIETVVHLKLGQSIVLSGISVRTQRHEVTGIPILSDIPVLGLLFGGHMREEADTEGAVFIVPSIVDNLGQAPAMLIDGALRDYERFSGNIGEVHPYNRVPPPAPPPESALNPQPASGR
jgi:pilus assembly protein CpaC